MKEKHKEKCIAKIGLSSGVQQPCVTIVRREYCYKTVIFVADTLRTFFLQIIFWICSANFITHYVF